MKFARHLARTMGRTVLELGESMSVAEFIEHYRDFAPEDNEPTHQDIKAAFGII